MPMQDPAPGAPRGSHGVTSTFHPDPSAAPGEPSILEVERAAIQTRRKQTKREDKDNTSYSGLALSGGGIRSASFCLGVIQALQANDLLDKVDYLSTVSGGGYTGCCLTACLHESRGEFPFGRSDSYADTEAVHHIRDYSNYLIPRGAKDVVTALGLVGRGLAANAMLLLPVMLAGVCLLLLVHPTQDKLTHYGRLSRLFETAEAQPRWPFIPGFPATTYALIFLLLFLVFWAFAKSFLTSDLLFPKTGNDPRTKNSEVQGYAVKLWKWLLYITVACAWLELQPLALNVVAHPPPLVGECFQEQAFKACVGSLLGNWLTIVTPVLAPVAAVATFLAHELGGATRDKATRTWSVLAKRLAAKALLWGTAIVVPSTLWLVYLLVTHALQPEHGPGQWPALIFLLTIVSVIAACFINPNATSLHRLYRDRLSKAFVFNPSMKSKNGDLQQVTLKLHQIDPQFCPYPIVNAALNIEGSAFANRRGRNADFFEFTPEFSGSEATHYVGTMYLEEVEPKLDLGTAMAISGAAISPNMGSATIKPLVPTLALLNVRLGFWMTNPRFATTRRSLNWRIFDIRSFMLFNEVFGRLNETSDTVYLTDGGNIENLGIYALLKRKCKVIIAVDAEADPSMTFGSFLKLERYARIDLGARIDLPWEAIRDRTLQVDADIAAGTTSPPASGCHVAVCDIRYGPTETGLLVYIKASLTCDEDDYVLDYKARNPDFPHETTGDQFFDEEQLEVYRALGFHSTDRFLKRESAFEVNTDPGRTPDQTTTRLWTNLTAGLS